MDLPSPQIIHELEAVILPDGSEFKTLRITPDSSYIHSIENATFHNELGNASQKSPPFRSHALLALPSLCHPHVHLDKPHLLTHPASAQHRPRTGSFSEALKITAIAKSTYTRDSVRERMNSLLADSCRAGVTHVRGFAEVDATVKMTALDAALEARSAWASHIRLQVCAFAQDPLFSGPDGRSNRTLMENAMSRDEVEVLGTTPYVESDTEKARLNVEWAVQMAIDTGRHLDFHLDYNVDETKEALIWWVLEVLKRKRWVQRMPGKTVCLGHCTRLTKFTTAEWKHLCNEIGSLPVHFVGLPTSDIFMMGRPTELQGSTDPSAAFNHLQDRNRCTLQVPAMIEVGLNACIGINNLGNAFTPYGTADPLALAQFCVGIYQSGAAKQTDLIYECVSTRAKIAIGLLRSETLVNRDSLAMLQVGDLADLVLTGRPLGDESFGYRRRTKVCEIVWDAADERKTIFGGRWVRIE